MNNNSFGNIYKNIQPRNISSLSKLYNVNSLTNLVNQLPNTSFINNSVIESIKMADLYTASFRKVKKTMIEQLAPIYNRFDYSKIVDTNSLKAISKSTIDYSKIISFRNLSTFNFSDDIDIDFNSSNVEIVDKEIFNQPKVKYWKKAILNFDDHPVLFKLITNLFKHYVIDPIWRYIDVIIIFPLLECLFHWLSLLIIH